MSLVCTRMSFVCTRMYPYITRMLLVVLVCCFSHDHHPKEMLPSPPPPLFLQRKLHDLRGYSIKFQTRWGGSIQSLNLTYRRYRNGSPLTYIKPKIVPVFLYLKHIPNTGDYYSTYCNVIGRNTAQIWSWWTQYPSSAHNRYPTIYVILWIGKKNDRAFSKSIFLDWFSQQLNRVLDSCWRYGENHLRKPSSQSASRNLLSLADKKIEVVQTESNYSQKHQSWLKKPFSIITDRVFLQPTRH